MGRKLLYAPDICKVVAIDIAIVICDNRAYSYHTCIDLIIDSLYEVIFVYGIHSLSELFIKHTCRRRL
ncbi:MAG: hypothetical protein QXK50_04945 [Ignisphaera sp.]|uniref:Uncharacterized protein n=1 Tax=Ignisphaera aggregans TaxID=334771 RepID=A0A832EQ91_9CREN